jgi:predicted nuclease with TOPRIM domain
VKNAKKSASLVGALCLSLLVALPALAAGGGAGAPPKTAAEKRDELEAKRKEWVQKYEELVNRHATIQADLERARADYSRGRSTKHLRGEGKSGLVEEIQRLEDEFAKVDRELQEFPDLARRDGAYPGWFRDVGEVQPELVQPTAAATHDEESRASRAEERAASRKSRRLGD